MGVKRFVVYGVVLLAWCLYQADFGLGGSVLTKEEATKDCGVHLHEWYTGCTKSVCFKATSADYIIHHECRPVVPEYEVPDTTNCEVVSNSSLTFPDCCPYVQCEGNQVAPTDIALACYDSGSAYACNIWRILNGCLTSNALYNFTKDHCQQTCGFC